MSVQGNTLVVALICFALAAVFWRYKKLPRGISWLAAATAFFGWFAFPALPAALASKAATSTFWLVALLIALIFGGAAFFFETLLAHRYHPVGTPLLLTVFAIAAGTTYAAWPQIEHSSVAMLPKAGVAIKHAVTQIRSAHTTQAATGAAGHQATVLLSGAAIVIVVFFLLLHRLHSRRSGVRRPAAIMNGGGGMLRRGLFASILGGKNSRPRGGALPMSGGGNAPVPTGRRP